MCAHMRNENVKKGRKKHTQKKEQQKRDNLIASIVI